MNFQPDLVVDDVRATGWCRVEIYGDKEYGKALIPRARTVLGKMKSYHGVYEQQVNGREATGGGGFYHAWDELPDGSRVHAVTNDGHDTIRIYTNRPNPEVKEPKKRENEFDPGAYLWVGVRVKDGCVRPFYALDVWLVEPDGTGMRGVVGVGFSTQSTFGEYAWLDATGDNENGWTLQPDPTFYTPGLTKESLLAAMFDTYDGFSPNIQLGDHQAISIISAPALEVGQTESPTINWSCNGLLMQYWDDNPQGYGPYDPKMDADGNAGMTRTFEGMNTSGSPNAARFGWDAVFWIDPFDYKLAGKSGAMVDDRPLTLAFKKHLRENELITKGRAQIMEGLYKLVVRAYDAPPEYLSSRGGEAIPDFAYPRSDYCDYADYMANEAAWPPLEVEVEIRIGRQTITQRENLPEPVEIVTGLPGAVFNFDLVCDQYDERYAVTFPFGSDATLGFDACTGDGGPNMGGPSFSQWVDIDVKGKSAELGGTPPERVFATGTWVPVRAQIRRSAAFFIYGSIFPVVSDGDWEAFAAEALFTAVESVTSGVYGCSEMNYLSEGEMLNMFAGTSKANVYKYDPEAGSLTNMGPPSTVPADWASNDPPDDSTNFFWYYENAVPLKNQCYNTYGVLVTSAGGFYEMSQNFVNTPGYTSPDCC